MEEYVFILDLDGTIIGNCYYQSILFNLETIMKKNNIRINVSEKLNMAYKKKNKLLRPYFIHFMTEMKKKFPNSYFYIYTASEKKWANKEIGIIEKQNNIKFNRPIFTRNDCIKKIDNSYSKSINKIIKKKHNNAEILVIDDNDVYIDYPNNIIKCPSYNYTYFEDLWHFINENDVKLPELQKIIIDLRYSDYIAPYSIKYGNMMQKLESYKWLMNKCEMINNSNHTNDLFWKYLTKIIVKKNITSFDKKNVYNINKYLVSK
jgi:hypothetical protein